MFEGLEGEHPKHMGQQVKGFVSGMSLARLGAERRSVKRNTALAKYSLRATETWIEILLATHAVFLSILMFIIDHIALFCGINVIIHRKA